MTNKIICAIGNLIMVVEAAALVFLISEWIKAKRGGK